MKKKCELSLFSKYLLICKLIIKLNILLRNLNFFMMLLLLDNFLCNAIDR